MLPSIHWTLTSAPTCWGHLRFLLFFPLSQSHYSHLQKKAHFIPTPNPTVEPNFSGAKQSNKSKDRWQKAPLFRAPQNSFCLSLSIYEGVPPRLKHKEITGSAGDPGSIPGSGRFPGEGNGYSLQYSCLENSMDRGAWQATVHGVTESRTWPSDWYPLGQGRNNIKGVTGTRLACFEFKYTVLQGWDFHASLSPSRPFSQCIPKGAKQRRHGPETKREKSRKRPAPPFMQFNKLYERRWGLPTS